MENLPSACDSLYVATHVDDLSLSCAGRIVSERRQGLRVLTVTLFRRGRAGAAPESRTPRALALQRCGAEHLDLDLPRPPGPEGGGSLERRIEEASVRLSDLLHRTGARHLYAPLALRTHEDDRMCHEAARVAFATGEGRSVFLYEERPEALVGGAVRVRLGELGARLPPAAAEAAERPRLPALLLRANVGGVFRGEVKGVRERARGVAAAVRRWRRSRAWNPVRALGPRLQPVVHQTPAELLPEVRALIGPLDKRVRSLAEAYAARLARAAHAERYWLVLPRRAEDGVEELLPAVGS